MRLISRSVARRAAALCLAALFAAPAAALFFRVTVHFAASFDVSSAPNGPLQADVGQISVMAPPTEFNVVPAAGGGGELKIHDNGTGVQATLVGTFKTVFKGQHLDVCVSVRPGQVTSRLDIRLVDDTDSGMIDATFGGDGKLVVNGTDVMSYVAGSTYDISLVLTDPLVGPASWAILVTSPDGGGTGAGVGLLSPTGQLTLKAVKLIRPAGASPGTFFVDDLKAVSSTISFK